MLVPDQLLALTLVCSLRRLSISCSSSVSSKYVLNPDSVFWLLPSSTVV
jgi:hypothetical protein